MRNNPIKYIFLILLTVSLFTPAITLGQNNGTKAVSFSISSDRNVYSPGDTVLFTGTLNLDEGWHIHANIVEEDYLIPTKLSLDSSQAISLVRINYPQPDKIKLAFSEQKVLVFSDDFKINAVCLVSKSASPGYLTVNFTLAYQACSNDICLRPDSVICPVKILVQ